MQKTAIGRIQDRSYNQALEKAADTLVLVTVAVVVVVVLYSGRGAKLLSRFKAPTMATLWVPPPILTHLSKSLLFYNYEKVPLTNGARHILIY